MIVPPLVAFTFIILGFLIILLPGVYLIVNPSTFLISYKTATKFDLSNFYLEVREA